MYTVESGKLRYTDGVKIPYIPGGINFQQQRIRQNPVTRILVLWLLNLFSLQRHLAENVMVWHLSPLFWAVFNERYLEVVSDTTLTLCVISKLNENMVEHVNTIAFNATCKK